MPLGRLGGMADLMNPKSFPTLTPYIVVSSTEEAIKFYEAAFGASCRFILKDDSGKVMNAQIVIGESVLMLNDEFPDWGVLAPVPGAPMPFSIHIASKSIDADFQRAVDAGATVVTPLDNMFWGDRFGQLMDPFGYKWSMGQPVEDLTP